MKQKTYDSVKDKVIKIIDDAVWGNEQAEAQVSHKKQKEHIEVKISDELNVLLKSIDVVECIIEIEKEFDILFPDEDAIKMVTVEDLVNYVCTRLGIDIPQKTKAKKSIPAKPINPAVLVIQKESVNKK